VSAMILTKSLNTWVSLIFALIILLSYSYKSLKKKKSILTLSFIFIIAVLCFIFITRWERLVDLKNPHNSIVQRLNYWRTAIEIIKAHPLLGVGPGNFQEVFLKYKVGLRDTRYAHNIFLHQWSETGLLGLIGLTYLIIVLLRNFKIGAKNIFVLLGGLAFIAHNLIDNTYFIPQAGLFFWILLALI
ncbi:MAG: O-antigen ligase family protein, partial [Candidatus Omnitrophota bacterium]